MTPELAAFEKQRNESTAEVEAEQLAALDAEIVRLKAENVRLQLENVGWSRLMEMEYPKRDLAMLEGEIVSLKSALAEAEKQIELLLDTDRKKGTQILEFSEVVNQQGERIATLTQDRDKQTGALLSAIRAAKRSEKAAEFRLAEANRFKGERDALKVRTGDLRTALIDSGIAAGCLLENEVSDHFLLHVPEEVKAKIGSLNAALAEAEKRGRDLAASLGAGCYENGCCASTLEVKIARAEAALRENEEQCSENWRVKAGHLEMERDTLKSRIEAETESHGKPCHYCGKPIDDAGANPSQWGIPLCHSDEPGVVKWHHIGCTHERLDRLERAEAALREVRSILTGSSYGCNHPADDGSDDCGDLDDCAYHAMLEALGEQSIDPIRERLEKAEATLRERALDTEDLDWHHANPHNITFDGKRWLYWKHNGLYPSIYCGEHWNEAESLRAAIRSARGAKP